MESGAAVADIPPEDSGASTGDKGLKKGAIGLISSVVIGVASTAPGYSLAASLGFVVAAGVGLQSPAIFIVAFLPMLCIAFAYYYLNRDDPDCGTTFTWVTNAMGPQMGWIGGWAIIVADIIVMANLSQIAGLYSFLLFGIDDPSTAAVTAIGVAWIVIMTWICTVGIELSAKTQWYLLGAEIVTLALFAIVALVKVYAGDFADSIDPSLGWLNPFNIDSTTALVDGVLVAVFIYWGWDSAVTVNEETEDPREGPGRSAVISTLILLGIYLLVSVAAQAVHGPEFLQHNKDDVLSGLGGDVFPSPLDKLLIIAVLTSAAASTQTTILPTARTSLSMAAARAIPKTFAAVHRRFQTPHISTIVMGAISIVWYVGLTIVSEDVLGDSIAALGLMIAFYYGLTGYACVVYYRKELFKSAKSFFAVGVMPLLGGISLTYILIKSISDLSEPGKRDVLGMGPPLAIAIAFGIMGLVFLAIQWAVSPEFFRRKPSTAPPGSLSATTPPATAEGGS